MTEAPIDIASLKQKALTELGSVATAAELESWRQTYLGRKGLLPQLLRRLKDVSLEEKRTLGPAGNELRRELEALYKTKWAEFQQKNEGGTPAEALPARRSFSEGGTQAGALHTLTSTIRRIQEIFISLGFSFYDGPLVEDPRYNFDLLNVPPEHPARAETDTFILTDGNVLRTHTSPVQIRAVLENNLKPPFQVFSIGRCFRAEKADATHGDTFYQVENLVVGTDVTIGVFKGVLEQFYSLFFGQDTTVRLRPSFFPFVEPAFEVDMGCIFCKQKGCRVCKHTGWIEMMGAGMVHPNVLKNMGVDSTKYQGYAFGGGVERLLMLQKDIGDLRQIWSQDIKEITRLA